MEPILSWGLEAVRSIQALKSPAFTEIMRAVSILGSEFFYFALLPLAYWCWNERKSARLGIVFMFSTFANSWLKVLCGQPRPYQLDPSLGLSSEETFGFPSGHAQFSLTFWGFVSSWLKRPWGLVLAIVMPLLIGFSRVYLGVHFPTDILGGWVFALIVLGCYAYFGPLFEKSLSSLRPSLKMGAAGIVAVGMNALNHGDTSVSGAFFGIAAGYILMREKLRFSAEGPVSKKVMRYLLGMAGAGLLYFGLKALFPGTGDPSYALFRFLRYGLLGLWVAFGAPWCFMALKLADRRADEPPAAAKEPEAPAEL